MNLQILLDRHLDIFKEINEKKTNIYHLERVKHTLELSEHFETIWNHLSQNYDLNTIENIYFNVGESASFTDSRIIFIWIKTWQYFNPTKTYYLQDGIDKNPSDIGYLKSPRITIKPIFNN
jgi:hypothetical protein